MEKSIRLADREAAGLVEARADFWTTATEIAERFVVYRRRNGAVEPLRVDIISGGEVLPIFASESAAWRYLEGSVLSPEWRVRRSSDGEIVSMLLGLCRDVGYVSFDPHPEEIAFYDAYANLVCREVFISSCVGCDRRVRPFVGSAAMSMVR